MLVEVNRLGQLRPSEHSTMSHNTVSFLLEVPAQKEQPSWLKCVLSVSAFFLHTVCGVGGSGLGETQEYWKKLRFHKRSFLIFCKYVSFKGLQEYTVKYLLYLQHRLAAVLCVKLDNCRSAFLPDVVDLAHRLINNRCIKSLIKIYIEILYV